MSFNLAFVHMCLLSPTPALTTGVSYCGTLCKGMSGSEAASVLNTPCGYARASKSSCLAIQGETPWVDPACADCPGFLVLGAAPAPASSFVSEPQIVPLC